MADRFLVILMLASFYSCSCSNYIVLTSTVYERPICRKCNKHDVKSEQSDFYKGKSSLSYHTALLLFQTIACKMVETIQKILEKISIQEKDLKNPTSVYRIPSPRAMLCGYSSCILAADILLHLLNIDSGEGVKTIRSIHCKSQQIRPVSSFCSPIVDRSLTTRGVDN